MHLNIFFLTLHDHHKVVQYQPFPPPISSSYSPISSFIGCSRHPAAGERNFLFPSSHFSSSCLDCTCQKTVFLMPSWQTKLANESENICAGWFESWWTIQIDQCQKIRLKQQRLRRGPFCVFTLQNIMEKIADTGPWAISRHSVPQTLFTLFAHSGQLYTPRLKQPHLKSEFWTFSHHK